MICKKFYVKKIIIVALSCMLLILCYTLGSSSVFAETRGSSGIYRIYYPVHEVSLLNKSDSLSVTSQTLNFNLNTEANDYYSHKLSSTYLINNSESSIDAQIAVPLQGTYNDIDLNSFILTVNGETVAPNIYLDKTKNLTKSYYHPQFNENGYKFDSSNVLANAFSMEAITFDSALVGTFYEFAPLDNTEDMIIRYTLQDNQKIYDDGFSRGSLGELTVIKKDYEKNYKYTVFTTSGELDFELTNATVVSEEVLSYNDFIPLIKQSAWFESSAKHYNSNFIDEYFDGFATNYLEYFLNDIKDTSFISSSIFNWISGYRYVFLVYDVQFLSNDNEITLERPIEHLRFINDYLGFDINNETNQNWSSFGTTTINVATTANFTYTTGDSFSLTKTKNSNYSFTGNLSAKEVYTVFYRAKKPTINFPAWLIVVQVVGCLCAIYLIIEGAFAIRRKIMKHRGKNAE